MGGGTGGLLMGEGMAGVVGFGERGGREMAGIIVWMW